MNLRKAHAHLLRSERHVVDLARALAVGAPAAAALGAFFTSARAAASAAPALDASTYLSRAESLAPSILAGGREAVEACLALAALVGQAHASLGEGAAVIGARLLPLANGVPKEPPLRMVQFLLQPLF